VRRAIVLAIVVVLAGLATAPPVNAEPKSFNRRVSGPFTGTTLFSFATPACSFVHQVYDGTYTIPNGKTGSFHLDGCVDFAPVGFAYTGGFVLTTPKGAVLRGRVNGIVFGNDPTGPCPAGTQPGPIHFALTVTQATAGFKRAAGSIDLAGTWCETLVGPGTDGTILGQLTGDLEHAHGAG